MARAAQPPATIELAQLLDRGTTRAVALWLEVVPDPVEREEQIVALSPERLLMLDALLDAETGEELVATLDPLAASELLLGIGVLKAGLILNELNTDLAADILRELAPDDRETLLSAVPADQAHVLRDLLSWPEHSSAAHMIPDVLTVEAQSTAAAAIDAVRSGAAHLRADSQSGGYVYVVDAGGRLGGVVAFRALVLAPADALVAELMDDDVLTVAPLDDPEKSARLLLDHRLLAVPVVDGERRILGIITADAAADIVEEEATEDAERQGGSQPLDVPYLRASPWLLWRKRIVWLLVLFVAEAYTSSVLQAFEDELEAVVVLAFFIPLLIGTGGNTGTQITSTLVRAMAMGQVRLRNIGRVVVKELSTAGLIAVAMAGAGLIRAFTLGVGWQIMLVVSLSLAAIVLWAALISSILPLLLQKTRVDPAVVSAPMIATIVDGTGLLIYFLIAKALLPELAGL
ncbi:magnesium transporter [Microbacterium sp.]|uniref:magnesium transporter n=1 Tax=Microbacterium sp. TaxID=51671 RepID=UPI003F6E905B